MKSRERIISAINRKPIDKIPFDFGATRSGSISALAYNDLKKLRKINEGTLIFDIQQQLAWPGEWLLERFDVDVIDAGRVFLKSEEEWKEFSLSSGCKAKIAKKIEKRKECDYAKIYCAYN
jgi:uroporphyrinogen decarboxylase